VRRIATLTSSPRGVEYAWTGGVLVTMRLFALTASDGANMSEGFWERLARLVDFAESRPTVLAEVSISRVERHLQDAYYVAKAPAGPAYLKLADEDCFLFERMDGRHTVKDLVLAYFKKYGAFAFNRVTQLVGELRRHGFLTQPAGRLYGGLQRTLARRRSGYWLGRLWRAFLHREFPLTKLDRGLTVLYENFFRLFFTPAAKALYVVISLAGAVVFGHLLATGKYPILQTAGSYSLGLLVAFGVSLAGVMIHEFAHAFATKAYGRRVYKGGFLIYFGMPAFFVDTTDVWMEPRKRRMAVSWAGPYSGIILAGLFAMAAQLAGPTVGPFLFKFSFFFYLGSLTNMNPLLELDGYYILMDALEIPNLRPNALRFVRGPLWKKLTRREALSRQEKVFTLYGVLSAAYTVFVILVVLYLWKTRLSAGLVSMWQSEGIIGKLIVSAGVVAIGVPLAYGLVAGLIRLGRLIADRLDRSGMLRRPWTMTGLALLAVLALGGFSRLAFGARGTLGWVGIVVAVVDLVLLARVWTILKWGPVRILLAGVAVLLTGDVMLAAMELIGGPTVASALSTGSSWAGAAFAWRAVGTLLVAVGCAAYLLPGRSLVSTGVRSLLIVSVTVAIGVNASVVERGVIRHLEWNYWQHSLILASLAAGAVAVCASGYIATAFAPAALAVIAAAVAHWRMAFPLPWVGWPHPTLALFLESALIFVAAAGAFAGWRKLMQPAAEDTRLVPRNDLDKLEDAFARVATGVVRLARALGGTIHAAVLRVRFNRASAKNNWGLSIQGGAMNLRRRSHADILEAARAYASATDELMSLCSERLGGAGALHVFEEAFRALHWQEREVAAHYVYRGGALAASVVRSMESEQTGVVALLHSSPLFADLAEKDIASLSSRFAPRVFKGGGVIIRQGDAGDSFYIVKSGAVAVEVKGPDGITRRVATLDRGDYFGEIALVKETTRTASCIAQGQCEVLVIDRAGFDAFVRRHFEVLGKVEKAAAIGNLVRRIPLFADFTPSQMRQLIMKMRVETVPEGRRVITQGEPGDEFYVLLEGTVGVRIRAADGAETQVATLGRGEFFGEIALLEDVPRTAHVDTLTKCELLVLVRSDFEALVRDQVFASAALSKLGSRRRLDTSRKSRILETAAPDGA